MLMQLSAWLWRYSSYFWSHASTWSANATSVAMALSVAEMVRSSNSWPKTTFSTIFTKACKKKGTKKLISKEKITQKAQIMKPMPSKTTFLTKSSELISSRDTMASSTMSMMP